MSMPLPMNEAGVRTGGRVSSCVDHRRLIGRIAKVKRLWNEPEEHENHVTPQAVILCVQNRARSLKSIFILHRPCASRHVLSMVRLSPLPRQRSVLTGNYLPVPRPPAQDSVVLCPACRGKMQRTDEQCPHCHAERHFGPTRKETLVSTMIGVVAAPALSLLLIRPSFWTGAFAVVGLLAGFFVAHSRHSGDRWLRDPR
ncbi:MULTISPECIES: hypothetical protein [unclassified Asaia]|uniref:hypothetical protein n=1 Tax=unclassified Asaia TaxID=2685023 RepID=UPI001F352A3A|nr:hypothetical protein [Asaia sp. W19]